MTFINNWPALGAATLVAVAATLFLQPYIEGERLSDQRDALEAYVAERAAGRSTLFDEAQIVQATAREHFFRHYAELDQTQIDEIFEDRFPVRADGTRRSRDEDFDGRRTQSGHLIYGFGAFLGSETYSARTRREMVAAYLATTSVGPGISGLFESLYFNDAGDNLIMFAPNRDDRLEYYRRNAPADFEFSHMSFVDIVQPATNPSGRFACTALTDLLYTEEERQLTIGCHLPVRQVGRQIGAFGMTLDVKEYLTDAVVDPSGREAFVVNRSGDIVAHAALFHTEVITANDVARVREALNLDRLAATITGNGQAQGVVSDPGTDGLAAFAKLNAPGWFLVIREPSTGAALHSWLQAGLLGLVGGGLVFFQLGVMGFSLPRLRKRAVGKDKKGSQIA